MARFVSQCCSCSFSYDITCPQLKIPQKPTIIGCAAAACAATIPCLYLEQCGNAIWAYGDTIAAVNGIITGNCSCLDASCTSACCLVKTCPCIQYDLSCCCQVYANPGTYYHRIRYVTASFEISEFSEPGCFCIKQSCYIPICCSGLTRNINTITYQCNNAGTVGVNQCVSIEIASDCNFSSIISTCSIADSSSCCIKCNSSIAYNSLLNPNSGGQYSGVGTYYTRITTYGGYSCQCVGISTTKEICLAGDIHTFALCSALDDSNCIQLFATYRHDLTYNTLPTRDTIYKFEVSPFCDFCSNVVTACGSSNVYIAKSSLGGAGGCANYFVRTCLLNNTIAPTIVRCVRLGNVTYPIVSIDCNNPACNTGRCCSGTINWTGPIAIYGIGSGGVGSINCPCNMCEGTSCANPIAVQQYWSISSGGSGYICSCLLQNPGGCLNGCTFCLVAGYPNCGSFRCTTCQCGNPSYFCIASVLCVIANGAEADGAGGLCGARNNPQGQCYPPSGYQIASIHGPSGNIKSAAGCCGTADFDEGILYNCCHVRTSCCTYVACDCTINPEGIYAGTCAESCISGVLVSYYCVDLSGPCCICNYACCCFPAITCVFCRMCGGADAQLNSYGLGGPGAVFAICNGALADCSLCKSNVLLQCNAKRGFGFGAGGPSISDNAYSYNYFSCSWSYSYSGCAALCCAGGLAGWWIPCYFGFQQCSGRIRGWAGGAGGMLFMCNYRCSGTYITSYGMECWQGRQGMIVMACQNY